MKTIMQKELNERINQHELWIKNEYKTGKKLRFEYCDLLGLDFSNRNLTKAHFYNCNLDQSNFSGSNLTDAYFGNCNLDQANFLSSNLTDAHFSDCILDTIITDDNNFLKMVCPAKGEFIGWKICRVYDENNEYIKNCIVKLLIPEDAKRSSAINNKCRCSKANVLGYYDFSGNEYKLPGSWSVRSWWAMCNHDIFEYNINEVVIPDGFDENRWKECTNGIHFYMSFDEIL